jgi:hypothetical protein
MRDSPGARTYYRCMRALALVVLTLLAVALVGCDDSDEPSKASAQPEAQVPVGAQALIDDRSDLVRVECSRESKFINEIMGAYPTLLIAARPTAACTIELQDGSILDLLRIQQDWTKIRRTKYGVTP